MSALAPILQGFFTDKLIRQRQAGPNTIGAYKLTFRLLLTFASKRLAKTPAALDIAELDGVPPTFRTADRIGSASERNRGVGRKIREIQARVS